MGGFDDVLAANEEYARGFGLRGLTGRAAKGLAVLTCMDSRIEPLTMLGLAPGDAKILRNAGARVDDGVIAALALAAERLDVTRVMVVAHTDCAAVRTGREEILREDVERIRSAPELAGVEAGGFVYDVETGRLNRVC
ncbi:MAG TPA: carbonic anhydrase [Gaiellaceae bacterium]|nr:carbonic anhydrase [Gaiellaceae bacterium]